MRPRRLAIPILVALLALLVAAMGRNLWRDLEDLSTAGTDNAQWTILQLDTEFANLHAALLQQVEPFPDRDAIRLRTNITLSRIKLVGQGVAGEIILSDERAQELLSDIREFADEAAVLVDGDLAAADIRRLTELTAATAPLARRLALRGIQIGAERTEARRREFAGKLRNTGLVAISLIAALAAILILLNKMLSNARKKDRELRASSSRFASTISGSLDAIVISDWGGNILDFNPAAEKVFAWTKSDLAGRHVSVLLPGSEEGANGPQDYDGGNPFRRFRDKGRVEVMARRRTGEVFPADLAVTSAEGDPDGLIIVYLRDISDQKINERALVDAKERAERTDRAKSKFLTIMSHEMRTPLSGILGVLDLLRTTELSDRERRLVDVAAASSEVLMRQLHEALDITRIETGSLILAPKRFNLAEEILRIVSVLEPLAKEKGLALTHHIDRGIPMDFVADGNRVGQIVTNLIGNAIKFTDAGSVEVTVAGIRRPSETSVSINVRDTGRGIPEKFTEAIFEDFVALAHSSGRMSRGDGLGLSISRKTARLMGGDIKVSSIEGAGSEFTLTLPLKHAKDATRPRPVNAIVSTSEALGPFSILIVEDNDINRTVLREMLEGLGHVVTGASGGDEGYEIARRQRFDLIFMDINMPKIDGIELTKMIRASDGPNRLTRIQGLTAYGREEFLHIAEAAGMDGFSTKPIRFQDIAAILRDENASVPETGAVPSDIDVVVIAELRAALGDVRLRESADDFFGETQKVLVQLRNSRLPDDREDVAARLHNLGGAAALFGLRALTEAVSKLRAEVEKGTERPLNTLLEELSSCARDARCTFLLHTANTASRKAG